MKEVWCNESIQCIAKTICTDGLDDENTVGGGGVEGG
jgi:hypothetical protein